MTAARPVGSWTLAGLVSVASLAFGCAGAPSPAPSAPDVAVVDDRDPVSLLPATVDSILTVDLVALRASAFAGPFLRPSSSSSAPSESENELSDTQGLRTRRGFDEIADIDTWVFARMGATGGERAMIELARGRYAREAVRGAFQRQFVDAAPSQFGTATGFTTASHAVVFLSEQVLAFGPPWALREVAGVMDGREESVRQEPWLRVAIAALGEVGPGVRPGMKTGVTMVLRASPSVRGELAEAVGFDMEVEHLAARIEVGDEARAYFDTSTVSKAVADDLAVKLREALSGLRERPSIAALGLGPVVRRAEVLARGPRVVMGLRITSRERARVAAKLAAFGQLLAKRREEARAERQSAVPATGDSEAPAP